MLQAALRSVATIIIGAAAGPWGAGTPQTAEKRTHDGNMLRPPHTRLLCLYIQYIQKYIHTYSQPGRQTEIYIYIHTHTHFRSHVWLHINIDVSFFVEELTATEDGLVPRMRVWTLLPDMCSAGARRGAEDSLDSDADWCRPASASSRAPAEAHLNA